MLGVAVVLGVVSLTSATPEEIFVPSPVAAVAVALPSADATDPDTGAGDWFDVCETVEPPVAVPTPLGKGDAEPEYPPEPEVSGTGDSGVPPKANDAGSVLSKSDPLSEPIEMDSSAQTSD